MMNCPAGLQRGCVRTRLGGGSRLAASVVAVGRPSRFRRCRMASLSQQLEDARHNPPPPAS